MADKKITYISLLQIIGPLFVVLGHIANNGFISSESAWWIFSKDWIYIFHMPLFFMVSGYLLSYKGYLRNRTYGQFMIGKVKRLLVPYLIINSLVWLAMLAWQIIQGNVSLTITEILLGFIKPRTNALTYLWFLFALFLIFLTTPLLKKMLDFKKPLCVAIMVAFCITLYILPFNTEYFALSDLHKDLLFFVFGCLLGQMEFDKFVSMMAKYRIWFIIGAIATSAVVLIWYQQTKMFHFIPCAFILLAFISMFVCVKELPPFFENLASYSFGIYIMHWPVMLATRILLHSILNVGVTLTAIAMCIFGYVIPILVILVIRALPFEKLKKPLKYLLGV